MSPSDMQLTEEEQEDMRLGRIVDSIIAERLIEEHLKYSIETLMVKYTLDKGRAEELRETLDVEYNLI